MHAISWKEFFELMTLGLLCYYVWLLIRYFPYGSQKKRVAGLSDKMVFGYPVKSGEENKKLDLPAGSPGSAPVPDQATDQDFALRLVVADDKGKDQELGQPPAQDNRESTLELAQALGREILALLEQAGNEKMARGQLIYALQKLLDKESYQSLRQGPFREKIEILVREGLIRYCSIHPDAEELKGLWVR